MKELWQLYDEQGRALVDKGAIPSDVFDKGLLHGAAHVWIWRAHNGGVEVLLQKRAADKNTWPNYYDISAAGHIDLGEDPITAALRETQEEIGIDVAAADLALINVQRSYKKAENRAIENEFNWVYLLELPVNTTFRLQKSEVAELDWKTLADFKAEVAEGTEKYVPHGKLYFDTVIAAVEAKQTALS